MKYIIIGFAILYMAIPTFMTVAELDLIDSFREFLSEWWDAFKGLALLLTAILAGAVAIVCIAIGVHSLGGGA